MDSRRLAEQLKEALTLQTVLEHYGFQLDSRRRMKCPFHEEKTASFVAHRNNHSWKCYGCGAGGTVIDFVMRLHRINFGQACIRLNSDFRLGFTDKQPDMAQVRRRRAQDFKRRQKERDIKRSLYALAEEHRRLLWIRNNIELKDESEPLFSWFHKEGARLDHIRSILDFYDMEGQEEWWKNYEHLQRKIS